MPSAARHLLFLAENKQKADPSLRSVESHPTGPVIARSEKRRGICFCEKKIRSRFLAALGMTSGWTFISIGGPKAHVTLGMTSSGVFFIFFIVLLN